ncbi:hypothetical protein X975_00661, partial [Stegodyphus mimosarum]
MSSLNHITHTFSIQLLSSSSGLSFTNSSVFTKQLESLNFICALFPLSCLF